MYLFSRTWHRYRNYQSDNSDKSPRSVDRLLQRVGRADHRFGGIGRGNVFGWDCDELFEASVIAQRAMQGEIEPVNWRKSPRTVVANQLILMAHSFKAVSIDEASKIIANTTQYSGWTRKDTIDILNVISENWLIKFSDKPSEVPWYRWPKAIYELAKEDHSVRNIQLPEDRPLFSTPMKK